MGRRSEDNVASYDGMVEGSSGTSLSLGDSRTPGLWLPVFTRGSSRRLLPGVVRLVLWRFLEAANMFRVALNRGGDVRFIIGHGGPDGFVLNWLGLVAMDVCSIIFNTNSRARLVFVRSVEEGGFCSPPGVSIGGELAHVYLTLDFVVLFLDGGSLGPCVAQPLMPLRRDFHICIVCFGAVLDYPT